jgi:ATP-dependent Lon protease
MISGVYKIVSLAKSDRCYIGSSQDIYKRWEYHLRNLKNNKHHSQKGRKHSPETKKKMSEWRTDYYMKKRLLNITTN